MTLGHQVQVCQITRSISTSVLRYWYRAGMQSPVLEGFTGCIQLQDRTGNKACFRFGVATRRPLKSGLSALQTAARVSSGLMLIAESHSDLDGDCSGLLLLLSAVLLVHISATSLFRHCTRDTITAHPDWSNDRTFFHVCKSELPFARHFFS